MTCPACGQALPEAVTLCPHCGHDSALPARMSEPALPSSDTQPANPPLACPRCGTRMHQSTGYCPSCGALMNAIGQWPPPLPGYPPGPVLPPRSPGSLVGGFFGGFAVALFGSFLAGAGLIVAGALYFVFRQNNPAFARGWGFGFLTVVVILFGLFATCIGIIAYGVHH